ncbi:MAG: hypothetical protein KF810_16920 [Rhizobiaceae bacterium]|nr:hypothetical protein [Rhizobiaceae bacterium]
MSSKLEEIARAMEAAAEKWYQDYIAAHPERVAFAHRGIIPPEVRALAAVKAMREPTEAMLWAYELPHIGPDEQREAWQAMIDSIIAEAEQEGK